MKLSDFLTTIPRKEINSLSDEELKQMRKTSLRNIIYILIPTFIIVQLGIWYGYDNVWKVTLLLVVVLLIPKVITTSRLSQEYAKRKSDSKSE